MSNPRVLLLTITIICWAFCVSAATFIGKVIGANGEPVADATVTVCAADSTITMYSTDSNGIFRCKDNKSDALDIEVQALGYERKSLVVKADKAELTIRLDEEAGTRMLDEVIVEADQNGMVERMANGQRFYLSKQAKAMNDPFMALKEIPVLISDPANSTVSTINGISPLILVDGIELNSGIRPILPEDIEAVEVIDVVPARYLTRGIQSILNIRLRKNRPPYIWTEFATRHEVPIRSGFGVGYFEVGNRKFSLYGRASANYTWHDDSEGCVSRENMGYRQEYDSRSRSDKMSYLGELLLKWVPQQKNYFAVSGLVRHHDSHSSADATGTFHEVSEMPYSSMSQTGDTATIVTASAYYKHMFSSAAQLEATGEYNYNRNYLHTLGNEFFGTRESDMHSEFRSTRNSGNINLDFVNMFGESSWIQAGSRTSLTSDRILLSPNPAFRHHNYNEYIYASYTGMNFGLYYMISGGIDMTWLTAGDVRSRYIRPRMSASITYLFNPANMLRLDYTGSNSSPSTMMLNPFNTSTDPLVVVQGNPNLRPQYIHSPGITYSFSHKKLYLEASVGADFINHMIVGSGFTRDDGVYVSTYDNFGHYSQMNAGVDLSYSLRSDRISGRISAGARWTRKFYTGHHPKDEFGFSGALSLWYRKFYFGIEISDVPKTYTDISFTKNLRPTYAQMQINYNITPNLYVAVALQGYTGAPKSATYINNGSFRSYVFTRDKELGFHPWILIRWNMRKHVQRKINLDKVLNSSESGIRLM